ncbi:hypothetical protein DSO57_1030016 [Entomophthora muscae]|uniref:Uncharacterized protein n=1 Tax=Entomophthora muscae TaxID=34485 RepID=A0ACC2SEF5_9FUNG|nr:hypothetical protein DSO57_1030016 [Entomophthora muscae]
MLSFLQFVYIFLAQSCAQVSSRSQTQLENTCASPDIEFITLNLPYESQSFRYIDQVCDIGACGLAKRDHEACASKGIPILISMAQSDDVELYDPEAVRKAYLAIPEDPNLHAYDGLDILVVDPTSEYLLDFLQELRRIHPGAYISLSIDYRMDISVLDDLKRDASINRTNLIMPQGENEAFSPGEENTEPQSPLEEPITNVSKDWSVVLLALESMMHLGMVVLVGMKR